jgi:peptidoglycan/LPS O-acetylase OafA/YrhL
MDKDDYKEADNMPQKLSQRDSIALYFIKAVAILSSVAAHTSTIDLTTAWSGCITRLWDMFSCISVGAFLMVGGVLYVRAPGDSGSFWRKKAKFMILPWVFCAVLTCAYRHVMGHPSSLLGYIQWVLGNGSLYYYVTVYLVMMVLFKPIWQKPIALWCCVAVSAACLTLRALGVEIPLDVLIDSEYLNPLYWMGFFALGILLRRNNMEIPKPAALAAVLVFAVSAVVVYQNWIYNYFHILNFLYSVSAFVLLLYLGRLVAGTAAARFFRWVGSATYCIYLLHVPVAPAVLRRLPSDGIMYLLAPIIGVAVMMVLMELGKLLTQKLPFKDKLWMLVGLR